MSQARGAFSEALGVDMVVLDQAIDTTTPAGRLLFHVLASISEFERDLIRDRVLAGLKRAKAQGVRLGRPRAVVDVLRAPRGPPAGGQGTPQQPLAPFVYPDFTQEVGRRRPEPST